MFIEHIHVESKTEFVHALYLWLLFHSQPWTTLMLFVAKVDVLFTCIALLDHINHFLSDSALQSFFNVKMTLKGV